MAAGLTGAVTVGSGAHAQDTEGDAAYGETIRRVCQPDDSIKVCNARIKLISATISKMHEVAPTGILLGAALAHNAHGTTVICGYGWENNIPGDKQEIKIGLRLHTDGVSDPVVFSTVAEVTAFGCGNGPVILYYNDHRN